MIEEDATIKRFQFGALPNDMPNVTTHKVRSEYVEEEWLTFIGPAALLTARRMDQQLATATTQGCEVKAWARTLGVTPVELLAALNRLARFGLGEWHGDQTFLLRRHWPTVPVAILTPPHREALMSLAD